MSNELRDEEIDEAIDEAVDAAYEGELPKKKKKKKHRLMEGVDPRLIPAGHERDETMKQIADELEQEAEELAETQERFALDPSKFAVENEIGGKADSLQISHRRDDRAYCWARFKGENGVSQAESKLALTINVREIATNKSWKEKIWHVVEGKDKEALELRQADGTRRLGDVILLWAKREVYEAVQAVVDQKRREMQGAPDRAAREFEARTGVKVVSERDMNNPAFQRAALHAEGFRRENLTEQQRVEAVLREEARRRGRAA